MGIKLSTYDSLDEIPDEKIRNAASSLQLPLDLEEQTGSYDMGGHPLLYSIDLNMNTIKLEYRNQTAILDAQNPSVGFSSGSSGYSFSNYSISGDFQSRRMIMNGRVCRKVHPEEPYHCREYVDVIITSW